MKRRQIVIVKRGNSMLGVAIFVVLGIFAAAAATLAYVEYQKQRDIERVRDAMDKAIKNSNEMMNDQMEKTKKMLERR